MKNRRISMNRVKRKINILDLRDSPWVDGPGRTVLECAAGLREHGFQVIVGSFRPPHMNKHVYLDEARHRGMTVAEIRENNSLDVKVLLRLMNLIRRHQVDLVHTHEFRSNMFGLLAARLQGIPVISTVHGWITNDRRGKLLTAVDRAILRHFNHVVVVSRRLEQAVTRAGVNPRRISVVYNTLQMGHYRIDRSRQSLKKELGLRRDTVLAAKIGRLSPEKGHLDLLEAFSMVVGTGYDVHLALIGIGPLEPVLRKHTADLGLENKIHFCGFRNDMVDCYNSIDLVVQASWTEGMPNVVLEALAMGVPVIATEVGGTNEIINNGVSGLLLPPGDPRQFADAIMAFLRTPGTYQEIAAVGRRRIMKEFDSMKRILQIKNIYEQQLAAPMGAGDVL